MHSPPLTQPSAKGTDWHGTELRTLEVNGRLVVTWRRAGDTCVLSGTGVTAAELQRLAAWKVPADSTELTRHYEVGRDPLARAVQPGRDRRLAHRSAFAASR